MKLSLIIPSIRSQNLIRLYNSVFRSCHKYEWEMVVASPFDLPTVLQDVDNVKLEKTYAGVPVAIQKACLLAQGELIKHGVDDGIYLDGALDDCIEQFEEECGYKDLLNCRYHEGPAFSGHLTPIEFWAVERLPEFHLPLVDRTWFTSVQPMLNRKYWLELGGFDCGIGFEYSNFCHHDLAFRLQRDNGKVVHSRVAVMNCDHMPLQSGDHRPIHDSQTGPDEQLFRKVYSTVKPTPRTVIPYENYRSFDRVWTRRFGEGKLPATYQELCEQQGYKVQGITA
jgi:hypothetical protein